MSDSSGPLSGLTVIDMGTLAPGSFGAMLLGDLGAKVIRIDRGDGKGSRAELGWEPNLLARGRRSIAINLKAREGKDLALRLFDRADALIEGFRPGVMERLSLGPAECLARNPRLVYARISGWGQEGPLAQVPGHDINYIALAGALHAIGPANGDPTPPYNIVGDFAGGGMMLALGVVSALWERDRSGLGQVIDAAMVDGSALLTTMLHGLRAAGLWSNSRGTTHIPGSFWYDVYKTSDGQYVAIGAAEEKFYKELCRALGLDLAEWADRYDVGKSAARREMLARIFQSKPQAEWCEVFEGYDACFAPVLSASEAPKHPHNAVRQTFIDINGVAQPAPAPRYSRTPLKIPSPPPAAGRDTVDILRELGFSESVIAHYLDSAVVVVPARANLSNRIEGE